jgi:cyclopropane fatty-acyl-phospholipid synthase-like methyltransferase
VKGEDDWMAKYFFTGGTMPSADLLHHFQDDLALQQQWAVNGTHYSRTLEDWLQRQDRQRAAILPIMKVRPLLPSMSISYYLQVVSRQVSHRDRGILALMKLMRR